MAVPLRKVEVEAGDPRRFLDDVGKGAELPG
jgi:hypothetical protein